MSSHIFTRVIKDFVDSVIEATLDADPYKLTMTDSGAVFTIEPDTQVSIVVHKVDSKVYGTNSSTVYTLSHNHPPIRTLKQIVKPLRTACMFIDEFLLMRIKLGESPVFALDLHVNNSWKINTLCIKCLDYSNGVYRSITAGKIEDREVVLIQRIR